MALQANPYTATRSRNRGGKAAPLSAHRAFPFIVALWFAALLGLGSIILPAHVMESLIAMTGLPSLFSAAEPPLGFTARALIALIATFIGAAIGLFAARKLASSQKEKNDPADFNRSVNPAELMRRPPLNAHQDLGENGFDGLNETAQAEGAQSASNFASSHKSTPIVPAGRRRGLALSEDNRPSQYLQNIPVGSDLPFSVAEKQEVDTTGNRSFDPPLEPSDVMQEVEFAQPTQDFSQAGLSPELEENDENTGFDLDNAEDRSLNSESNFNDINDFTTVSCDEEPIVEEGIVPDMEMQPPFAPNAQQSFAEPVVDQAEAGSALSGVFGSPEPVAPAIPTAPTPQVPEFQAPEAMKPEAVVAETVAPEVELPIEQFNNATPQINPEISPEFRAGAALEELGLVQLIQRLNEVIVNYREQVVTIAPVKTQANNNSALDGMPSGNAADVIAPIAALMPEQSPPAMPVANGMSSDFDMADQRDVASGTASFFEGPAIQEPTVNSAESLAPPEAAEPLVQEQKPAAQNSAQESPEQVASEELKQVFQAPIPQFSNAPAASPIEAAEPKNISDPSFEISRADNSAMDLEEESELNALADSFSLPMKKASNPAPIATDDFDENPAIANAHDQPSFAKPVQDNKPDLVRIDEPETPAQNASVIFPNQEAKQPTEKQTFGAPPQSLAQAPAVAPTPQLVPQPLGTAPNASLEDTDRALREALMNLQRMGKTG